MQYIYIIWFSTATIFFIVGKTNNILCATFLQSAFTLTEPLGLNMMLRPSKSNFLTGNWNFFCLFIFLLHGHKAKVYFYFAQDCLWEISFEKLSWWKRMFTMSWSCRHTLDSTWLSCDFSVCEMSSILLK